MTTILPFRSLRWRLPFSYAAIALLTALILGITLLVILRAYYQQRERLFLEDRAARIGTILQQTMSQEVAAGRSNDNFLEMQAQGLAFLTQVRVRLLDPQSQLLADSGTPLLRAAFTLPVGEAVSQDLQPTGIETATTILTQSFDIILRTTEGGAGVQIARDEPAISQSRHSSPTAPITEDVAYLGLGKGNQFRFVFDAPMPDLFLAQSFGGDVEESQQRSLQTVQRPLYDAANQLIGYVELSEGPAYGRQIVRSAAWAALVAGLLATLLAALVGWWTSRQLSRPILQLTHVTAQMAAGQLSVRAAVQGVDEVGQLAHSFNEMAEQVETTVNTLRHFVADAAHEINTPITALRTNLELAPANPWLQTSLEQLTRLETLVRNLLLLSRLEAAPSEPFQAVDLAQLLQSISEPFAARAEQRDLTFTLTFTNPGQQLYRVNGNAAELSQALQNLLDNALKFSADGGSIGLHMTSTGNMIVISVEDTGIGVAADEIPLLFQRFYRARNAAAIAGNGLGLTIVKAIVERHGGSVSAERRAHGLGFVVQLPVDLHQSSTKLREG